MKSRREEYAEATRAALLKSGRQQFGSAGFDGTSLERVAENARVTTGAIYHHFNGKKGLFQAVAEDIEGELLAAAKTLTHPDLWQRLRLGLVDGIERCAAPDVQRILFIEAPQVIGAEAWREIELRYAYGGMRKGLAALQASGRIGPYPLELLARLLLSLLREGSAELARCQGDPTVRAKIYQLVDRVLDALRGGAAAGGGRRGSKCRVRKQ